MLSERMGWYIGIVRKLKEVKIFLCEYGNSNGVRCGSRIRQNVKQHALEWLRIGSIPNPGAYVYFEGSRA